MITKLLFQLVLCILLFSCIYSQELSTAHDNVINSGDSSVNQNKNSTLSDSITSNTNISEFDSKQNYRADTLTIEENEQLPKWYEMITKVPGDWYNFTKQQINEPNYPIYLLITGLTAGLLVTDDYTWRKSDEFYRKNQVNRNWSDIFTEIGDGRSQFGFAAGFAAYGFIAGDRHSLKTASQIVEAVLAAGAVVQVFKHITGRESPFVSTKTGGTWRFFPNQVQYHKHVPNYDAFPSGHIATSVAAFVVIAENYPEAKWIKPASYCLTGLIGIGMVNKGIHWYSDYPLGIAIGYAFGKLIANPEKNGFSKAEGSNKVQVSLLPYIDSYSSGLTLKLSF